MIFTLEEYGKELIRRVVEVETGKSFAIGVNSAMSEQSVRIFQEGKKSDGSGIGNYDSKNPLYASDDTLPRQGNHTGKTGKGIKTSYYANYKALRSEQGRESGFVNLRLTNELQSDYNNSQVSASSNKLGTAKPIKKGNLEYEISLNKQINVDKKNGLEAKYGTIFDLSQEERKTLLKVITFETLKIYNA